jgi:hypothetical protein
MRNLSSTLCALALFALIGFAQNNRLAQSPAVREIDSPAGPSSGEPNLFATADGRVFLSWIERTGEKRHALRFAVREGGKWSEPRVISEGDNWFVNWADFP